MQNFRAAAKSEDIKFFMTGAFNNQAGTQEAKIESRDNRVIQRAFELLNYYQISFTDGGEVYDPLYVQMINPSDRALQFSLQSGVVKQVTKQVHKPVTYSERISMSFAKKRALTKPRLLSFGRSRLDMIENAYHVHCHFESDVLVVEGSRQNVINACSELSDL